MPKPLTATEIVQKGDYLRPNFDPKSLTIPQLLGVFSYHEIRFPTPYTKGKLVQLFDSALRPQAPRLLQDRLRLQHSQASNRGITDGRTGQPIGEASGNATEAVLQQRVDGTPDACRYGRVRAQSRASTVDSVPEPTRTNGISSPYIDVRAPLPYDDENSGWSAMQVDSESEDEEYDDMDID